MSVRIYSGPHADRRRGPNAFFRSLPWVLAIAVAVLQIIFPLVSSTNRRDVVVITVVVFFLATVSHALLWRGPWWTVTYLAITLGVGLFVEVIGTRTGLPFGSYRYSSASSALGSQVLGVPWVIPLAWAMMAYPVLCAARRLSKDPWLTPTIGALALAGWDVFLDPMMTGEGYWRFIDPRHTVPHIPGIPLSNFGGWLLTGLILMLLLDRLPRRQAADGQPAMLLLWTYVSSVIANLFFLHRPWVALYGGIVMGLVVVPFAWALWTGRD